MGCDMNSPINRLIGAFCAVAALIAPCFAFSQTSPLSPSDVNSQAIRIAVAHEHTIGWCLGYLYVTPDAVKYVAATPAKYANHSFEVKRSQIAYVGQWTRLQQPLNAMEMKVGRTTYHFWVMPNEQIVQTGRGYQWNPPDAVDPHQLIAIIQGASGVGSAPPQLQTAFLPAQAAATAALGNGDSSQVTMAGISRGQPNTLGDLRSH
jgi:hypothetical protein